MIARQNGLSAQFRRTLDANSDWGGVPDTVRFTRGWSTDLQMYGWQLCTKQCVREKKHKSGSGII